MTANEFELIKTIRENDNPGEALAKAVDIILLSLVQPESFEGQAAAYLQVQV